MALFICCSQKKSYLCRRKKVKPCQPVPWMSGLVSGLQNHVRRFESARYLKGVPNGTPFFCAVGAGAAARPKKYNLVCFIIFLSFLR